MLKIAKNKKTPFSRAVLLAGTHDPIKAPIVVNSASTNIGTLNDQERETIASDGPSSRRADLAKPNTAGTSMLSNAHIVLDVDHSQADLGTGTVLSRSLSRSKAVQRNRSYGGGFAAQTLNRNQQSEAAKRSR